MILLPQVALSQKATTNLQNETVTLDKEKAIDVAKIIKEYERLQVIVGEQLDIIRKQDSLINSLANKNIAGLDRIQSQSDRISQLSGTISELAKKQLELEEKKNSVGRLFIGFEYEFNNPYLRSGSIKADYFGTGRFSFGASINPFNEHIIYGGSIGVRLF